MQPAEISRKLERYALQSANTSQGAAVLIPLIEGGDGLEIVLEVRAPTLLVQPNEVCLPGGGIEEGEAPAEAAIRETAEELRVDPAQIKIIGSMGPEEGPRSRPLHVFVGKLDGYDGGYSTDEVDRTFTLSLDWLVNHEPRMYEIALEPRFPDDFPFDRIPGGRAYPWHKRTHRVPFYLDTDPLVWGVTARVLARFSRILREQ